MFEPQEYANHISKRVANEVDRLANALLAVCFPTTPVTTYPINEENIKLISSIIAEHGFIINVNQQYDPINLAYNFTIRMEVPSYLIHDYNLTEQNLISTFTVYLSPMYEN